MHRSVEEFYVKTREFGGLGAALNALRLPYGNDTRSDVIFSMDEITDELAIFHHTAVVINRKDLNLLSTLVKRGDEHAKVLRGVTVWCEINAPRYWWQECDRYSVGATCLGSNSTMHQQGKGLSEDELVDMKEHLEEGTMQKRIWMFSYQTLRRIYFQRRNHRLPQWRIFCEWIERLPFAKELITVDGGDNKDKSVPNANHAGVA